MPYQRRDEPPRGTPFSMTVCRCRRCGAILYSADAVRKGYGFRCWRNAQEENEAWARMSGQAERSETAAGQTTLFDVTPWD